jgi:4'-phosphopantetheinyl transferase
LSSAGNVVARALPPPADGVQVWWRDLGGDDRIDPAFAELLSLSERARAERFGTPLLRARYVAGRATLRLLLGRFLDIAAADVPIARGRRGRPYVERDGAPDFNVSHTRDAAIIALSTRGPIGVDLERGDRTVDAARLARKFATPRERAAMATLGDDDSRRRFLRLWTCKEAMSKATGDGLAAPMGRLDVDVGAISLRLVDGPAPYAPADWSLVAIDVPATHMATAALWRPSIGDTPREIISPAPPAAR